MLFADLELGASIILKNILFISDSLLYTKGSVISL